MTETARALRGAVISASAAARRGWRKLALAALLVAGPAIAAAQDLEDRFRLLDVSVGAYSAFVRGQDVHPLELSDGSFLDLASDYDAAIDDLHFDFVRDLDADRSILAGFGTGSVSRHHVIMPSIRLGAERRFALSRNSVLAVTMNLVLGGDLRETACRADYNGLASNVAVNCRLAASPLPPERTLAHLWRLRGIDQSSLAIRYIRVF